MHQELKEMITETQLEVNQALAGYLPESRPEILHQSMAYSVNAGGKRLRPILVLWTGELIGGEKAQLMPIACALELIHTYSLIHDDLPCMDDDDLRRGMPTNHRVYGEAGALLAGDALLTRAFFLLADTVRTGVDPEKLLQVIREVSTAAGSLGMIGGQFVDISVEGQEVSLDTLQYIHQQKTGALFRAAIRSAAILSGVEKADLARWTRFAEYLGLVFQITDDILDVIGDEAKLGKPVGSDQIHQKATYPALLGLERSQELARENCQRAKMELEPYGQRAERFFLLLDYILYRES